jgi:CO/xanthine dehydrogenase Mo-binding subunit
VVPALAKNLGSAGRTSYDRRVTGSRAPDESWIGQAVLRKEDGPLLSGRARFVDDIHLPEMVYARVVRSTVAHAAIEGIETELALAHPDVLDVVTGDDLPPTARAIPVRLFDVPNGEVFMQPPLARGAVRYSGEPVAMVVARTRYGAEDAAELVGVSYEPLPVVLDPIAAASDDGPLLHAAAGTNVAAAFTMERGDVEVAFESADLIVSETLSVGRHAAVPLETRGLVAKVEEGTGILTVWGAAKIVHINRRILASLIGWPEERIRLIEVAVGGGFGARGEFYPEDFLIPWAALRLGRAVSWTEDRDENLRATNHSREQVHKASVALSQDGEFLGFRDEIVNNAGAYVRTHGAAVPALTAALLPGPYRWPAFQFQVRHVVTNKTPAGTYRSPGRYEGTFVRERLIDMAARRLGRDPLELRLQNMIPADEMPYAVGTETEGHATVFDSGDYARLVDRACEQFDYPALREWASDQPPAGRRRGIGAAFFVEKAGIGRWEYARVTLASDGRVVVHTGVTSLGQGVETVLAQICAEHLGVSYDVVSVEHGDTATVADGMGSFGSRATMLAGAAVMDAAQGLRAKLLDLASELLEADASDLSMSGDRLSVRGAPAAGLTLRQLSDAARPLSALRRGGDPGLSEEAYSHSEDMSFPYGLHIACVEVDLATGQVDVHRYAVAYDAGVIINPQLLHGQIVGGVAQGAGGALLEEFVYDDEGQLTSGSFMDYLLPTASEVPAVDVLMTEDAPTPLTRLGAKGGGEGGTAAAGAAIANAVSNALGAEVLSLPMTPERVLELAAQARGPAG